MRGDDPRNESMFSYVTPEQRVPADHPLRPILRMVDDALATLCRRFDRLYADTGRPSIAPEKLLRALLLQLLYSIRSERMLMEQLEYNLLFRWFVGLSMDDPVWDPTVFSKNRDRLLRGDVAAAFFDAVLRQADAQQLLSDEHFTVDGTLLEAWASHKSFRPKRGAPPDGPSDPSNPTINFRGERRSNETHQSTTDPEARLYKKGVGRAAQLSYLGHVLMENRHGLIVGATVTAATGTAECDAALALSRGRRGTLGGDKAFDNLAFITAARAQGLVPHVAQNTANRRSRIDGRTTRHPGYAMSQRKRKLVEQTFGWIKTTALLRKVRHRGRAKVRWVFTFAAAAFNLVRIRTLMQRAVA
jgi:transposase